MSSSASTASTAKPSQPAPSAPQSQPAPPEKSRIPVTPALLRSIFASSRTPLEERSISRAAFFRFAGFVFSCLAISLAAARNRGIRSSAALLNVV